MRFIAWLFVATAFVGVAVYALNGAPEATPLIEQLEQTTEPTR